MASKKIDIENQLEKDPESPAIPTQPAESAFAKAVLAKAKDDGLTYQVIFTNDEFRPVKARIPKQASGHPGKFWEGTQDEFNAFFDRI